MSELQIETQTAPEGTLAQIAKDNFGSKFHGEVPETTEVEVVDERPEETEITEQVDEVEEAEQVETEEVETVESEESEDEGEPVSSLTDFAEYLKEEQGLDVSEEFFEKLEVKGKVNGEEVSYTIGDLKAAVQKVDAADNILATAKEKTKEIVADHHAKSEFLNQQYGVVSKMIEQLETGLQGDHAAVDWGQLKESDPGAYAAARQDYNDRLAAINAIKGQAWQE